MTTIKINGSTSGIYRRDEYFQNERTVSNGTNPQYPQYTIAAELNGGNNTRSGNVFVPKTPEVFTPDADGNLTKDGRWNYTWDGENRLVQMEADTVSVPAAARRRLRFEYDWQGRRIRKQVYNWDAVALNYATTPAADTKFLYDGWNLLMELYGSNNGYLRAYTWGQDLSGTMQGAGGVGGLLIVKPMSVNPMFVSYDGNGNVSGLFDSSNGNAMARYDYGPFGELIRLSGTWPGQNPFRFSTKYTDDETDLVYYGYRYYNPSTGRWINRDPMEERGGINLNNFVANYSTGLVDTDGRRIFQPFPPSGLIISPFADLDGLLLEKPLDSVDHLIRAGFVPKCFIAIYMGHNRPQPPRVPRRIRNSDCSAASTAACYGSQIPVELPIPGIETRADEFQAWSLAKAKAVAARDFEAAKRHAKNVCKGNCCKRIVITVDCTGLNKFERFLANDICWRTEVINCGK